MVLPRTLVLGSTTMETSTARPWPGCHTRPALLVHGDGTRSCGTTAFWQKAGTRPIAFIPVPQRRASRHNLLNGGGIYY